MKIRKLAVCAIAVLAILLAGCGKEKEAEPPVETAMTEAVYAETQETETMQGTEEDYYAVATTLPADVAEEFALGIREDILRSDWETLAKKVTYPITIGESVIPDEEAFLALNIDERLDPVFVKDVNE